jgi:hypothetical protein
VGHLVVLVAQEDQILYSIVFTVVVYVMDLEISMFTTTAHGARMATLDFNCSPEIRRDRWS